MKTITLIAVLMATSPAALAQDFRFTYTREDLLTPALLYERIADSAKTFCRRENDIGNLGATRICVRDVIASAIEQIGHPQLMAHAELVEPSRRI